MWKRKPKYEPMPWEDQKRLINAHIREHERMTQQEHDIFEAAVQAEVQRRLDEQPND